MKHLKLSPQSGGTFTKDYDPKLHPGIANEFAAAAYRFGHSQIQVRMKSTFDLEFVEQVL